MAAHTSSPTDTSHPDVSARARRGLFTRKPKPADPKYVGVKLRDFPEVASSTFCVEPSAGSPPPAAPTWLRRWPSPCCRFPGTTRPSSPCSVFLARADSATAILAFLKDNAPTQMYGILEDPIKQLTSGQGAGLVLLTGILSALWFCLEFSGSFGPSSPRVYGVREGRPGWLLKPINVFVTAVLIILLVP